MKQPLKEIIASKKFVEFSKRKSKLALECKRCSWVEYCHGGCPRHRTELGLKHNYFCLSYSMFFNHAHKRLLKLKRLIERNYATDIMSIPREHCNIKKG